MSSINWNPLNLKTWQVGLAAGGGAVVFVFVVVLAVLAAQGAFVAAPAAEELARVGSYTLNDVFTITKITDPAKPNVTFPPRWSQTFTRVVDLSTLPGSSGTQTNILAAWKGAANAGNGNEYVTLIGEDGTARLRLSVINQTSGSMVNGGKSAQLKPSIVTGALPQGTTAEWKSSTAGTSGDALVITYA